MSERSALGRVRGIGSAKEGVGDWWTQRLTSVALVVLGSWFVVSLLGLPDHDFATVAAWMRSWWRAPALILFVLTGAWHSQLGVRVIIEDYVHEIGAKTLAIGVASFAHIVIAAIGVVAVLRVALGGAA
ncbi:MAG TPA: succinate dehydrogenase, hydrophobic membrane anchor protein [Steroidobacteraceae bacterium]|nr:succinate dehydrogenase, hydrophobic membrane anchor protein [Steroidobacteraceae bacterium]